MAQGGAVPSAPSVDSIAVIGAKRFPADQIITVAGIPLHSTVNFRDISRAITDLYSTAQFDDVQINDKVLNGHLVLIIIVKERPILRNWTVIGAERIPVHDVDDLVHLSKGTAINRPAVAAARFAIDSMYHKNGYYAAKTTVEETAVADGVDVAFRVEEGARVVISEVRINGNTQVPDKQIVAAMSSKPEGFWWFRDGRYDERRVDEDVRDNLPTFYGQRGLIDFQVNHDTLLANGKTGKAILQLDVDEGKPYDVGTLDLLGNSRFSTEDIAAAANYVPDSLIGSGAVVGTRFDRTAWENATAKVTTLYQNNGYISARVDAQQAKRTLPDGRQVLDLRWQIVEGEPAVIRKINIYGDEVTHEQIIRQAIVLLPGELFNKDRLIRSYQNIANLGFFQQPMPVPDVVPVDSGDVDINFRVQEKHTGNINFGASVGQGTGLGGFLGLEEPNMFGKGKHGKVQWQFGQNINDFTLSYTDPALFESRLSGTVTLYDSQLRYVVGDLGEQRSAGGSVQIGIPFLGSRYARVFASYGYQHVRYTGGAADLQAVFRCTPCTRSTLGLSLLHDTRIGLPFPIAGSMVSVATEQNGGILGGDGDYQKVNIDTRWFTPLGSMGGKGNGFGGGVQFTLGLTAKSGFIFGNSANFFTELFSMGGVQYGIPLRGYSEFSITPNGFDPNASTTNASPASFGKSFAEFTIEAGARISQSIYVDLFSDAGNVYRSARQYDPTRLYRSIGIGAALVSPLGPIGIDLGYGLDKTDINGRPAPGFQVHFRLGNFY